ncbi:DUF1445 domain protein, partial [Aspergillus ellipticus CBS 707.79]
QAATQTPTPTESHQTRLRSRANTITNTAGLSPGTLQANLLILPSTHSTDFHNLCLRNPVSCPLLGITSIPGNPHLISPSPCIKTPDFDLRTDCPRYRVYQHGKCINANKADLLDVWPATSPNPEEERYVGFLLGCSYSFESALTAAGLAPRHQETGTIVAMYKSNIPLLPAGVFTGGCCIVSMRPYKEEDVVRVRDITRPYLATHGEPVDWGWGALERLGIRDLGKPDFGDAQVLREGEVPVFWACGVTPQMAVEAAGERIDGLVFAHEPGHMLVTDWRVEDV